ncbi:hypothetical protein K6I34_006278, partial [Streptomyces sp. UNOC14_S4]
MTPAIVTVVLAFTGYLVTYVNGLRLAQQQERLARVNRQLAEFYGPLLALAESNHRAYRTFAELHPRPDGSPPTEEELAEWRLWMTTVLLPNLRSIRDILTTKADLLSEPDVPEILQEVYAHAAWDEITAARWGQGDLTHHPTPSPFPATEFRRYVKGEFERLKREQAELLGKGRGGLLYT